MRKTLRLPLACRTFSNNNGGFARMRCGRCCSDPLVARRLTQLLVLQFGLTLLAFRRLPDVRCEPSRRRELAFARQNSFNARFQASGGTTSLEYGCCFLDPESALSGTPGSRGQRPPHVRLRPLSSPRGSFLSSSDQAVEVKPDRFW